MFNSFIVDILKYLPADFVWIFSKKYIAGSKLEDAVAVTKKINIQGIKATMDLLGEFQTREEKVEYYKSEYIRLIHESVNQKLNNSFSVKPTMFGLLLNEQKCYMHIRDIVALAASFNRFVRIDMEDSQCTDKELSLYRRLFEEFPMNVGIVLQACLKRTFNDIADLVLLDSGRGFVNIRLCKGIYNEPAEIAFKDKAEINLNYVADMDFMFQNNIYAAIATHDKELIESAYRKIDNYKINNERFEFQMLYGVTPELRKSIINKGFGMRVYVPYGKDWLNYSIRRLKENPRIAQHIIKALFLRK